MGFVPIFITLGGFVFLFVLLVQQNLRQKKRSFNTDLHSLALQVQDPGMTPPETLVREGLESLEKRLRSANAAAEKMERREFGELLARAKRTRYEYNHLLRTKPYSFVASLFGHHPL